jgi:hypothetical protein
MLIIGSIYRVIYNNINLISDEILCEALMVDF